MASNTSSSPTAVIAEFAGGLVATAKLKGRHARTVVKGAKYPSCSHIQVPSHSGSPLTLHRRVYHLPRVSSGPVHDQGRHIEGHTLDVFQHPRCLNAGLGGCKTLAFCKYMYHFKKIIRYYSITELATPSRCKIMPLEGRYFSRAVLAHKRAQPDLPIAE
jgi:hypothetical protein